MIDAITQVAAVAVPPIAGLSGSSNFAATAPLQVLGNKFAERLDEVNQGIGTAETMLQQLAAGEAVELYDAMLSLEQARIGVQTLIQVRNRLTDAYQEVMRMQI